ncbi:MAG: anhydro-N-acetylmuramic acid kinase [Planctomycetota bacterium]|nr:anhydro-N-acetylmuramic acid kinase [Planctomycetota bacterium]
MANTRHALGFMSGTSLDGLDAAIIRTEGRGRDLQATVVTHRARSFAPDDLLSATLRDLARNHPLTAAEIADVAAAVGCIHADLLGETCTDAGLDPKQDLDLVAIHGQTVTHRPPRSWQLVDPWPVAAAVECPVVCDLRSADLQAGGAGAPITPRSDAVRFRDRRRPDRTTLILNLGGFANATLLPDVDLEPTGFDCCPCNHLLDAASREALGLPFDPDGRSCVAGTADEATATELALKIGDLGRAGRSGGDGDEHREAAAALAREASRDGHPEAALATIAVAISEAVVRTVTTRLANLGLPPLGDCLLAGGGMRNRGLRTRLEAALGPSLQGTVRPTGEAGVDPQAREAAGMAVLGLLALDGESITTTSSTGRATDVRGDGLWIR